MERIKLDMLTQISFGNRAYLEALLEGADEELEQARRDWLAGQWGGDSKSAFDVLHKIKTTLGMVQASAAIIQCQSILDALQDEPLKDHENAIEALLTEVEKIQVEIKTALGEIRS